MTSAQLEYIRLRNSSAFTCMSPYTKQRRSNSGADYIFPDGSHLIIRFNGSATWFSTYKYKFYKSALTQNYHRLNTHGKRSK